MRPRATASQLQRRRRHAIRLWQRGKSLATVAQRVGAGRNSVWRWVRTYQQQGMPGLRARPIPGRPSYLCPEQKTHLAQVLVHGAQTRGYQTELWTLERIAKVVWDEFHIRYRPKALWYLVRQMGWSCQKPERRSCQRNEPAIAHWKQYEWPHIKKGCTPGGTLGFLG